jgi:tetratricopeptide (TPR) repeat protein
MDAFVSGQAGVALLIDGDNLMSIHANSMDNVIPRQLSDAHLLLGEAKWYDILEDVNQEQVCQHLKCAQDKENALQIILIILDSELSADVRQEAVKTLEELLILKHVPEYLECILYARNLPKCADIDTALKFCELTSANLTNDFLKKLNERQIHIESVCLQWERIPLATFGTEDNRDYFHTIAVHEGLFRDIVENRVSNKNVDIFVVNSMLNPFIKTLHNYRHVILQWVRSFQTKHMDISLQQDDIDNEQSGIQSSSHKPRRFSVDRIAVKNNVDRQKVAIIDAMRNCEFSLIHKYTKELIEYQLKHARSNEGPGLACKSLCDLAIQAKELHMFNLQLYFTFQSISLKLDDGWAWAQYADALLNMQKPNDAMDAYERARSFGEPVIAKKGKANVLKALGRLPEALAIYNEVITEYPQDVYAKNGRAEVLKSLNLLTESREAYEKIIAEHPEDIVAKTGRAEVLKSLNLLTESREAYEKIIAEHPEDIVAKNGRAEVLKSLNLLTESREAYEKIIAEHPEDIFAKNGRAEVLKSLNLLTESREAYEKIIAEHPEDVVAKTGRAEVLKSLNLLTESREAYEKIIAEHPEDIVAKNGRAEVLKSLNLLTESREAYEKIIAEHPEDIFAKTGRAEVLKSLNLLTESREAYEKIIAEHPEDIFAKTGRAEVLKSLNLLTESREAYEKIIAGHPESVVAKNGLACILAVSNPADAMQLLPEKDPVTNDDWIGYHIRGMILLRQGDLEEAIEIFEEGVRSDPRPSCKDYFRTALAVALLQKTEYAPAVKILEEVKTPLLQTPANVIRLHAYGRQKDFKRAAQIYNTLPSSPGPILNELQDELYHQFVIFQKPRHNEEWLIKKEIDYFLLAA